MAMLNNLKTFIEKHITGGDAGEKPSERQAAQMAAAVLLVEVMYSDNEVQPEERYAVSDALHSTFGLGEQEAAQLMDEAGSRMKDMTSLYDFTRLLNVRFTAEQKVDLVEQMWRVVFADGRLDKHEEYLVRRVADLLYVPHGDFIRAKLRAKE